MASFRRSRKTQMMMAKIRIPHDQNQIGMNVNVQDHIQWKKKRLYFAFDVTMFLCEKLK